MRSKRPVPLRETTEEETVKPQECNGCHIMQLFSFIAYDSEYGENREHRECVPRHTQPITGISYCEPCEEHIKGVRGA
jgi:hypothetical protein